MNKTDSLGTTKIKRIAHITGFLYFLLIPLGVFGVKYIPSLIVSGNATATADAVLKHETLFNISVLSALVAQLVNIAVVILLYKILMVVNKKAALLMVLFSLLAVPIAMLNELNNLAVLELSKGVGSSLSQINLFFNLHEYGVQISSIFFGLWLLPMGYLVYKSKFMPKFIGILLYVAGFGYTIDSFIHILSPNFSFRFTTFTFIGEVVIVLWLLIKGVNAKEWQKQAELSH